MCKKCELLNELYEECDVIIRASEDEWAKVYHKDKASLDMAIKAQSRLARSVNKYFDGLAGRIVKKINWSKYKKEAIKAYEVSVDITDDAFDGEDDFFLNAVEDDLIFATLAGATHGNNVYKKDLKISKSTDWVLKSAKEQGGKLITEISSTTKDKINRSIKDSIDAGKTVEEASKEIDGIVKDSIRAELIARTETVNAFHNGLMAFGNESDALAKQWETVGGGCEEVCAPLDGQIVGIDEQYPGDGGDGPTAHPNCQCGERLLYADDPELPDEYKPDTSTSVDEENN